VQGLKRLVREIHRRSLWQVLGIYVVGSWAVLQVVDVLSDNMGLPPWTFAFAVVLLLIGLPIVLATAFVQEGLPGSLPAPDHGADALAIEWYEKSLATFYEEALYATPQTTLALRRLGELYDAQGNTAKAVEYNVRFTDLWKDADPELQPMVRRAQDRLQALVRDRG
jgi:hypothetical protein